MDKNQFQKSVLAVRCPLCRADAREVFADWLEEWADPKEARWQREIAKNIRLEVGRNLTLDDWCTDQCLNYGYQAMCPAHQEKVKPCL